jgi:hypothetical protein
LPAGSDDRTAVSYLTPATARQEEGPGLLPKSRAFLDQIAMVT